jgi:hypothetical protein
MSSIIVWCVGGFMACIFAGWFAALFGFILSDGNENVSKAFGVAPFLIFLIFTILMVGIW